METDQFTVIVADGEFPSHAIPLDYLKKAERIVCCDGSAEKLINAGFIPDAIVGDMDSLSPDMAARFDDRIYMDPDQETNDLTKTVMWCSSKGFNDIIILGATGKREDHTLGNISLLLEYANYVTIRMVTDTGIFAAITGSSDLDSFPGQQVSVFSPDPRTEITSYRLKYPLERKKLANWWMATLNEALDYTFRLEFDSGRLLVYRKFGE